MSWGPEGDKGPFYLAEKLNAEIQNSYSLTRHAGLVKEEITAKGREKINSNTTSLADDKNLPHLPRSHRVLFSVV